MKKILIAIVVSVALSAPVAVYAGNNVMVGAGFGFVDVGLGSSSGYMFSAQVKLNEDAAIAWNFHEGSIIYPILPRVPQQVC